MGDVIFVLATIVFFLICVAYVTWCDRIIGPDDFGDDAIEGSSEDTDGSGQPEAGQPADAVAAAMTEVPA